MKTSPDHRVARPPGAHGAPDRRRRSAPTTDPDPSSLLASTVVVLACAAVVGEVTARALGPGPTLDAWVLVAATTSIIAAATSGYLLVSWKHLDTCPDRTRLGFGLVSTSVGSIAGATLAAGLVPALDSEVVAWVRLAPLVVGSVALVSTGGRWVSATHRTPPRQVLLWASAAGGLAALIGLAVRTDTTPFGPLPTRSAGGIAVATALIAASACLRRTLANGNRPDLWCGVVSVALAGGELAAWLDEGPSGLLTAGLMMSTGSVVACRGVQRDLGTVVQRELAFVDALARDEALLHRRQRQRERTLAQLAHDQRSAALALQSTAQVLAGSRTGGDQIDDLTTALESELSRMRRRLDGLPTSVLEVEFVPVWDVIGPVLISHSSRIRVLRTAGEDGVVAYVDPDALAEVVSALVSNAADHGQGDLVLVEVRRHGAWVHLTVEDRGPGIPPELRDVVFQHGVTTAPDRHSGLGLSGAASLVAAMGGSISVADCDRGARVEVVLPARPTAHTPAAPVEGRLEGGAR